MKHAHVHAISDYIFDMWHRLYTQRSVLYLGKCYTLLLVTKVKSNLNSEKVTLIPNTFHLPFLLNHAITCSTSRSFTLWAIWNIADDPFSPSFVSDCNGFEGLKAGSSILSSTYAWNNGRFSQSYILQAYTPLLSVPLLMNCYHFLTKDVFHCH